MSRSHRSRNEMRLYERSSFAREWLEDARLEQDESRVFSAFFSGYIALAVASSQISANNGESQKYVDESDEHLEKKAIEFAMTQRARAIDKFLISEEGKRFTGSLRSREVPEGDAFQMIGPLKDHELKMATQNLFTLWSPLANESKGQDQIVSQANHLGLIFRKVRNRLFHGEKLNDPNGTDADLLERLNPILFGVVAVLLVH